MALPVCVAWMVQVPTEISVTVAVDTPQTEVVSELKLTGRPDDALALTLNGGVPYGWFESVPNEMVWLSSLGAPVAVTMVKSVARAAAAAPPPVTLARLVNWPGAAADTFTVTVIAEYEDPPIKASERVQAGAVHVQPLPAIDARVKPAGRTSVTVTVPAVVPAPAPLVTVKA